MQQLHLSIPEPCHENWQQMTPTEQGRFCNACAKQVVDFSMMTDYEVINYFNHIRHNEKVCGRALPSQLDRAITMPKEPVKKRVWYWGYITMVLLFFSKQSAKAQGGMIRTSLSEVKNRDSVKKMMTDKKRVSLGGVVSITSNQKPLYVVDGIVAKDDAPNITAENIESLTVLKSAEATAIYGNMAANGVIIIATKQAKTIKGKVTDEEGNPVSFASIQIKGSKNGVAADAEGAFAIKPDKKQDTIIISSVGYQTESFNISSSKNYNFVLKPSNITLGGEVVITTSCSRRLGGLTMGYTVVQKKTIIDTVKSILNIQKPSLNIYPNPVNRGNNITLSLKLKKQGVYSVQIINSDGELLKEQKINIPAKEFNQTIATDSRWAAGTYFIKIIDEKNNAVSTQRFIAQ